jgi:hypothetical protein
MGFSFDASDMLAGLNDAMSKSETAVKVYAETAAKKLEGHAKTHAPWTDRTGAARNRLQGYTEPRPSAIRVNLAHGVDYGLWLELANEKKYATVAPTINNLSQEVFNGLDKLFDRMR